MTHEEVIRIAQEAGFTVALGKYPDTLIVTGRGNLSVMAFAKFAELVADRCSEIASEGGYNCLCDRNILRKMAAIDEPVSR